jgi:outer membrane receptor protein involved in Fe transport
MGIMGLSASYDINQVVGYKPEQSWNFELGSHLTTDDNRLSADISAFYIRCNDQQLTRFPEGNTTGRIMSNAGKARSFGAEVALRYAPLNELELNANYGYTNAKFIEYNNGKDDFAGKYITYSPSNTFYVGATYTKDFNNSWFDAISINANVKGAGKIYWNEDNSLHQPFYATANASIRVEHKNLSLDIWAQNLTNTNFKTFYFVSIGNAFLQRGKPRCLGATLRININ